VSVSASFEEKRMSVLALAHTLTLFSAPLTAESCNWINDLQILLIGGAKLVPPFFYFIYLL
jgi:hypothetical protein